MPKFPAEIRFEVIKMLDRDMLHVNLQRFKNIYLTLTLYEDVEIHHTLLSMNVLNLE